MSEGEDNYEYDEVDIDNDELSPIAIIDLALLELENSMNRYVQDSKNMFDTKITQFLNSNDCNTLQKLSPNDSDKFIQFMISQSTYQKMLKAKIKLTKHRRILEKNQSV